MLDLRIAAATALIALGACSQNDLELTRRVEARLADAGVADQVKVTTERRVVVLEGVVANRAEINRIELEARATPGIMGVDNRLVVQQPVNVTGGELEGTP
jgi:osmotically-inducible protein OsmY